MDEMGTPGPNHPAHRGLKTPNNVVAMPLSNRAKLRHKVNKIKDALFEPEQVTYATKEPVAEDLPRQEHFEAGQQEATIHSFRAQQIKRNMKAGDESVSRMINMKDPTKD